MASAKPFLYWLENSFWGVADLFFPPVCPGCQTIGERWCQNCQASVTCLPEEICDVCGQPSQSSPCDRCKDSRPSFVQMRSWAVFKAPVREALHTLKYRRNFGLGQALAASLVGHLQGLHWPVQALIPIPLSQQRQRERGYNQVDLVAHTLAYLADLSYLPHGLYRARHTRSQVGLSVHDRKKNVSGAFLAESRLVAGRNILLMDDVCTTGATLTEAARALLDAGAQAVYAYTIARAVSHKDA